ncbi:Alpha/Beta hydrolase protein [Suillus fuscotomentosus]|uniref:Alpha/Beta hydrolase protein n=1 Tax=Suillus fuscotomentosus TaxID=1912939 RepID=A0AAD4E2C6_9AGAM|nr:Alpha/Beta hydrolase protein [Suillus fuscotomentosus]KAG1898067.1 Alpha/Beta hydrolase protein [Suillus fuscotomentosus]
MFMRTLIRAGLALVLAASISITLVVSVVKDNQVANTETGHVEIRSKVHNATGIRYIKNSGICETTPNVTQISGYINVGTNMSMWFWFFESRNSPETAPFTLWLNGGPGCSSMIGLFQENGPCLVNADRNSTTLNPYSWNNLSNMIYIDQPIGTGFSYGTDTVNSTEAAAPFVWTAFQVLFESQLFSKYASREFIFATESYGGHYGPSFVTYFDGQNALIASGEIDAVPIVVSALMINNGWYDPLIQNIAYLDFATYAPGYGQLQPDDVLKNISDYLYGPDGCVAQENACYAAGTSTNSNKICRDADNYCIDNVFTPAAGDYDSYDIRQNSSALFPPEYYVHYLRKQDIMKKIGAQVKYEECPDAPYEKFVKTGDDARTWLPQLSALVNSRMKILIWAGDADMNCNWLGGHASVLAMDWYGNETLHNTPLTNMTIDGKPVAAVQNVDNFSFAVGAGHEVAAFQPQAALEIFSQVVRKEQLHSV